MSNQYLDEIYKKKYLGVNIQKDWEDYKASLGVTKKDDAIKVLVYIGVINVAYYRVFAPFMELAKNPMYDVRVSTILSQQDDVNWADIVYFSRCVDRNIIAESKRAKAAGKKVMFETDDYMHGLPDHHPQKRNIENSRYLMDMDELCKICDVVTVSTDYLKKLYTARYPKTRIEVLPNCVRLEDYDNAIKKKFQPDKLYLGWGGSSTHFEDLRVATSAIVDLINKYENLILLLINYSGMEHHPYRDAFEGIPFERRIHVAGTEPHLMYNNLGLIDIGIAPLLDNEFNRGKSNVKFLEYSMCSAPMVATKLSPYQDDANYCVLVKNNFKDWYDGIEKLIVREDKRTEIGRKANQWVRKKYDINANLWMWERLLRGLVDK